MDGSMLQYPPGDPRLVDKIVCQLKSQGIFDRFRKECIADVDTKPAYQNLHQRVEGTVSAFLTNQEWRPELNKNQLRDSLRKHIHESGILDLGVERIVDQVVNPKILPVLLPQIEDVVYNFLGIEKPKTRYSQTVASLQTPKNLKPLKMETLEDLLPKDLDPISPGSVGVNSDDENSIDDVKNEVKDENMEDEDKMCEDEDSSPPFEPIEKMPVHDESSLDSHISGISGLTSHDSQMSNLSYGKERPPPEPVTPHKIPPIDLSNQDSQLSKVSSGSRLSIVFSDDVDRSDQKNSPCTSDMDIQNDDSGLSKNGGIIEFEPVAPPHPPPNEDSNCAYDSNIQESPDRPLPYSPLESLHDKEIEEPEPVLEAPSKIDDIKEEYPEIVKEPDVEEKVFEDGEKEREIPDERKHFNTNSDSRDSRRSESTSHTSDSEHQKEEKEQILKSKDYLKCEDNIDSEVITMVEDKQRKESEDVKIDEVEKLEKDVEERDHFKLTLESRCEMTTHLDNSRDDDKNLQDEDHKEGDFTKENLTFDERDFKEKVKNEDTEKVKSDKDSKETNKEKSDKESKEKNKEKSDKESKEANKEKSDKEYKKSHHDDKGKENVKDRNKEREMEREGSREKIEKEISKEKTRHDEKNRDSSREKAKTSDKESSKEKQKVDVKIEKDNHRDKTKFDDKSRKDVSKDKARHERSDKGSGRDSSRHKEQERSRSKSDGKEKKDDKLKDDKSKDDKNRRNEKEASKDKLKKDVSDGTKNEEGDEKRNKSQSDQKREKERSSRETSRHADKSKSDKGKSEEKVKEVKSETKDVMAKHESKDCEKSVTKDSRSKTRTESKEKDDRNEKRESRKDERNRDNKSKEDRNEKDKPKEEKKDKPKDDKVDRDRSRSDKEKPKDHKSEREKPKDDKEKDRSSRSSHSSKDGEISKKSDRESSSKSRSSSSTSGASDKSRDSRKKEKEKSRSVPDDHSSHRDRNSDDRRSTDRDSNGAAHGQSASTRNEAPTSRRNGRSTADDGGSNTSSKSEGGGSGGGGGGNKSADTTAVTPTIKESTDARNSPSDESVAPSLPFKKRPVVSSPEPNEGAALDEYDCVNNAPGKLVLKLKKPRIAANIFEVRKIMHLRKSMAKNEKKKQSSEETSRDSSGDDSVLRFFTDEEARPDAAFLKFVSDLEKSETLNELASSDEEEMPEHSKAKRAREEPSTSGETLTPLPSVKVKTGPPQDNIETLGRIKTEASSVKKESPASSEPPRGKPSAVIPERREKRRREKDVRTRVAHINEEGPASPQVETIPSTGEYLPKHISDVLGIDSSRCVNISEDPSPVSEEVTPLNNVTSTPSVSSVTRSSPTLTSSPVSRIRPPKRKAAGSPVPAVPDVLSVVTPKRLRNDISSVSDVVPSVVAVDIVKTVETTAPRIIYPSATTSRPSTLGLRKVTTTRSLSPGIINYGGYISKEIVEVKVLDADGDDEYSSSIKENNNVDKSSSDDEKGCGDDMSLSKELISSALRDLMMESGLNLGESPATPAPTPPAASKEETGAEGAASATGRRGGAKAARGRRLGLARPTRRSGSDSLSPQTSGEFVLSPSRDRDAPEAKAAAPAAATTAAEGASAREGAGSSSSTGASAHSALAGRGSSCEPPTGARRQLR